ncbi:MAG: MBG domain-containing protein [Limisphaerales bacterium]
MNLEATMLLWDLPCRLEAVLKKKRLVLLVASFSLLSLPAAAQSIYSEAYTFTTFAGKALGGSADGAGTDAQFDDPEGVAVDNAGNVYVADSGNCTIRKITSAGEVSTIAGFAWTGGSADGTNSAARFYYPGGVAVDSAGNVYVADSGNCTIRKMTPVGTNWVVSTIAGLADNPGTTDGTNSDARFGAPNGVAVDSAGNLYVGDWNYFTIRKITPVGTNWVVSTIAGSAGNSGTNDGTNSDARFYHPEGVAVDTHGNVYVADSWNYTIRKITPVGSNWVVSTIAGQAGQGHYGSSNGVGTNAQFSFPNGIALDANGNLYVGDYYNSTIRKITPIGTNWVVSTFAGQAGIEGYNDGTGTNAIFNLPNGTAVDTNGNVYVADANNDTIRMITPLEVVSTMAGSGPDSEGSVNGTGSDARFDFPLDVAVDSAGNVYVADSGNNTIRKITSQGVVSTIAGLAGATGTNDGAGSDARFYYPEGVAVDSTGNVYVADSYNATIRKVTSEGLVTTLAGLYAGTNDGAGTNAQFNGPSGVAVDSAGNVYVSDTENYTIRKITPVGSNWVVSTIAGLAGIPGTNDGTNSAARFSYPCDVAVDSAGNVYVSDNGNSLVRKITPVGTNWVVSTIAWLAAASVAVDRAGNVYVANFYGDAIQKIIPVGTNWVVSTIAGAWGVAGSADGAGSAAMFDGPQGVAVDGAGNVYVADTVNNTIRKGVFTPYTAANPVSVIQPANNATLVITLFPPDANGQWRFPWELAWRASGTAATNLVPNQNYTVQFSPVPGYLAIPVQETIFIAGGTNSVTGQYYPTITSVNTSSGGSLEVVFQVNPPSGAGWRLLGDTNAFLPSGFATNLLPGNYLIEFAAISNFTQLPIQTVQISAGLPTVVQEIYQGSQPAPTGFLLPEPVPSGEISDTNYPYGFNGQLETEIGYGSGVAVEGNVVLTAAHLVFNDQTLTYVSMSNVWWYPQEEAPQFVPYPQQAQGTLILSGYASARTNDLLTDGLSAGQSSPESRNFDVAALYFSSPVAGGGYSGYLPSDATPNYWLTSTANKMLVGYPVDGSMFQVPDVVPGQMYEIGPQPYPLSMDTEQVNEQQEVYTASWFLSYPGNSGGPFYVEFNGCYYPAGVYLGTLYNGATYASAVRAIDSKVVNLITNAQYFVTTGTNNSGGGVVTITANQAVGANNPGYVQIRLGPPAAVQAGAGWRLQGDATYSSASNYTEEVFTTNALVVQFAPVSGYSLPTNQTITVAPGTVVPLTNYYTLDVSWSDPAAITYGTPLGASQLNATVPAITNGTSGRYSYNPTNGTILRVGAHTLSVTFTPGDTTDYGSASASTNVSLVVSPATLTVTASNAIRLYGQTNPVFGGTMTNLQNGDNITACYTCNATTNTAPGTYAIVPSLVDPNNLATNYTVTLSDGMLTIIQPGQLVQNSGFETGDFSFWTPSGNAVNTGKVANIDIYVNSAFVIPGQQYGAELGPAGSLGYLSQTLPTTVGQLYLLSLWLDSPDGLTPNEFSVAWNGTTIFDRTNLGAIGWTNLQFNVAATTTNTLLQIGFRDDPSYLGLDDVSVLPLRPVLQNMIHTISTITFTWSALPGSNYQIQTATNLTQTNWTALGGIIDATNYTITIPEPRGTNAQQFYRVVLSP